MFSFRWALLAIVAIATKVEAFSWITGDEHGQPEDLSPSFTVKRDTLAQPRQPINGMSPNEIIDWKRGCEQRERLYEDDIANSRHGRPCSELVADGNHTWGFASDMNSFDDFCNFQSFRHLSTIAFTCPKSCGLCQEMPDGDTPVIYDQLTRTFRRIFNAHPYQKMPLFTYDVRFDSVSRKLTIDASSRPVEMHPLHFTNNDDNLLHFPYSHFLREVAQLASLESVHHYLWMYQAWLSQRGGSVHVVPAPAWPHIEDRWPHCQLSLDTLQNANDTACPGDVEATIARHIYTDVFLTTCVNSEHDFARLRIKEVEFAPDDFRQHVYDIQTYFNAKIEE